MSARPSWPSALPGSPGASGAPVVHGGAPAGWLDFSANLNPCGVPEAVARAVAKADYDIYGALDPRPAEEHLARDAGVDASQLLLTAGAGEGLRLLAEALLTPGDTALIVGPTYGEYARLVALRSGAATEIRAEQPDFRPPIDRLLGALAADRPRLVFLCDPNNPTGARPSDSELSAIVGALHPRTVLAVDQSFAMFAASGSPPSGLIAGGQVALVRSLTKSLAAPGLRIGYVLAAPELIEAMRHRREPWPLGAHAIAAAAAASWRLSESCLRRIHEWRARLATGLAALGLHPLTGEANFLLVEAGAGAGALIAGLAAERIALRPCVSFGLPNHIRVAVRPPDEQDRLLAALGRLRDEGRG